MALKTLQLDSIQRSHFRSINQAGFTIDQFCQFTPGMEETHVAWALFKPHMGLSKAGFVGVPPVEVPFLILASCLFQFS